MSKIRLSHVFGGLVLAAVMPSALAGTATLAGRQIEVLDRGVVAVPAEDGGVLVSWRVLGTDAKEVAFNLYRDGKRLNDKPLTTASNFRDQKGKPDSRYEVRAIINGSEEKSGQSAGVWAQGYLSIPLQKPADGVSPDGKPYSYSANDASVGDLDGDGRYEIVLKWDPSNSHDNSHNGYTGNVYFDAYTLEGKRLWRIDMGPNIRAGAHYSQYIVFDFDGDGRSELAVRTSDGTVDGTGAVLGDAKADWRIREDGVLPSPGKPSSTTVAEGQKPSNLAGRILSGPEYLTVFDGLSGKALSSAPYNPPRYTAGQENSLDDMKKVWGDAYGNRIDRFLAGVAYLDGQHPSILMARGYYGRITIAAWDWREGKLSERWFYDSTKYDDKRFSGQGNHQLSVADVDGDGRDEIIYGSLCIDDNGKPLWSTGMGHGDTLHVSDLDPSRPGLERFGAHEEMRASGNSGSSLVDARTGEVLWKTPAEKDTGRAVAFDIDPRYYGAENWNSSNPDLYDIKGNVIPGGRPGQMNFGIWWDGDLLRELLDKNQISKWNWSTHDSVRLLTANGAGSNNGTKSTPALSADILGDWREELILRNDESTALRLYATPYASDYRFVTLMHDSQYREAIAWQNVGYNQPPHPSFYIGAPPPK